MIPNLQQLRTQQEKQKAKVTVLERLYHRPQDKRSSIKSEFQRGLKYYRIALQHHKNGVPHLDILLMYDKSIQRRATDFDYLYKHGHVTTYRRLNQAVFDYGSKQDADNLHNFPVSKAPNSQGSKCDYDGLIQFQQFKKDPYLYLYNKMHEDPVHFNLQQYVQQNQLSPYISGWSSLKIKLKDMQIAAANLKLKNKPGFRSIDRNLIQQSLSSDELRLYDSWSGYQRIVDYLNQIPTLGGKRQMKTLNLLITGGPSIGKTSLFHNPNHKQDKACVQDFCSVYPMGMSTWFPQYRSGVYKVILWNQAKLTAYSYDVILKLLQGSYVDLPVKGGVAQKRDNPLIVMTSNMTLNQMIHQKFLTRPDMVRMAKANLAVRVQNVVVPPGYDLFLLQKLLRF